MPLSIAPEGRAMRITKILADANVKKRLESLGITVMTELTVVSGGGGNVICLIKGGRLALDQDMATKIFVA